MHTHQMIVFQKTLETVETFLFFKMLIPIPQDKKLF